MLLIYYGSISLILLSLGLYIKRKFNIVSIGISIFNILSILLKNIDKSTVKTQILGSGSETCFLITYTKNDLTYHICLPYDYTKIPGSRNKKVKLQKDGLKYEITQEPGLSYHFTCEDLSGQHIEVHDLEEDEREYFFQDGKVITH